MITSSEIDVKEPATIYQLSFKEDATGFSFYDKTAIMSQKISRDLLESIIDVAGGQDKEGNINISNLSTEQIEGIVSLVNQKVKDTTQELLLELQDTPVVLLNNELNLKELIVIRRMIVSCLIKHSEICGRILPYMNIVEY